MDKKICRMVTDRIINELQNGVIPWHKPWTGSGAGAISHSTGKPYSLLNQFILGKPGEWLTFNQCKAEGGSVRKGEKGSPVVFWKQIKVKETQPDGSQQEKLIPMLKYYTVFHIDQCEGITPKYAAQPRIAPDPIETAERIVDRYEYRESVKICRAEISDKAFYSPSRDYIQVPALEQYDRPEEYYSTLFHEMTHSTGHASRLNRFKGSAANAAFGSAEYSKEELIAEIGAATLNNHCGIETAASFKNSAAYVQGWLEALNDDPTMIIAAAGKAEKAAAYIVGDDEPAPIDPTEPTKPSTESTDKAPETETGAEAEKAAPIAKPATKAQNAAAKRIIRKNHRAPLAGFWFNNPGRVCVFNDYMGIRTATFTLPDLPEVMGMERVSDLVNMYAKENTLELELPTADQLKALIKERKAAGVKIPLYDFGDGLPAVNAQYLLDMLILLPGSRAFTDAKRPTLSGIYFESCDADGLLLPVRKK